MHRVVIDRRPSEGNNSVPMLSRLTSSALKLDYSTHYGWIQLCQCRVHTIVITVPNNS